MKRPTEPVSVDEQVEAWLRHIEQLYMRCCEPGPELLRLPIVGVPEHLRDPLNDALKEHGWQLAEGMTRRLSFGPNGEVGVGTPAFAYPPDDGGFWRPGADRFSVTVGGTSSFFGGTLYLVPDMPTTQESPSLLR